MGKIIIQACILFGAKLVIIIFYISQTVLAATMTLLFYFFSPKKHTNGLHRCNWCI